MTFEENTLNQNLNFEQDPTKESKNIGRQPPHVEFTSLPEYEQLMVSYQSGEWNQCNILIDSIMKSFPEDIELIRFKNELETKAFLHGLHAEEDKKKKNIVLFQLIGIAFLLTFILVAIGSAIIYVQAYKTSQINSANEQIQFENLKVMESQARQLIQGGKPVEALVIIKEVKTTNLAYPGIDQLEEEANTLIKLDTLYSEAMKNIEAKKDAEALSILKQIDAIRPFYRDVNKQEAIIQNRDTVANLAKSAQLAYQDEKWQDVIKYYDEINLIDQSALTSDNKEQLLNSYLNTIINMLKNPDTKIGEVDQAEIYYRKAIALFPQSKLFAAERANLQKLSRNLLVFKYVQMGKLIINDPNPSKDSINQAIIYLAKAYSLDPENTLIKSDLDNARLFQVGYQFINTLDMNLAIDNLTRLSTIDQNYGNGKVKQMLYEANVARGNQYYDLGIYLDARINYEAAENIAFGQTTNILQLYQVQILLGNTIGKLRSYKESASYYKYALNSIEIYKRLSANPEFIQLLKNAEEYFAQGLYQESFNIYTDTLKKMTAQGIPYSYKDIDVQPGTSLIFIAQENSSTIQTIQEHNKLTKVMIINNSQKLSIPYIK